MAQVRPNKATVAASTNDRAEEGSEITRTSSRRSSRPPTLSQRVISQTLSGAANLANLLPTGTVLAFQMLTPVFTSNGDCDSATRSMTFLLLLLLALFCFLASFTDSVKASDGRLYYGFATSKGLWLFDDDNNSQLPADLTGYKVSLIDWVHAVLSVLVFGTVALGDKYVVACFYPKPSHQAQELLNLLPIVIGLLSSFLFVVFPTTRHGIGYPLSSSSSSPK